MVKVLERFQRLRRFVLEDVWSVEQAAASGLHGFASRIIRIVQLVVSGFTEDDLTVHAASLTFSTLMALVPVLAIASSLLKAFDAGGSVMDKLVDLVPGPQQEFVRYVLTIVHHTKFAALGWAGVIVLFVTAVQVLASVENTFNQIWGVQKRRTWLQRFTNYTSITIIVPLLASAAFAVSATARTGFLQETHLALVSRVMLKCTPLLTMWLAFFLLYMFMPNLRVQKRAAMLSAFLTALLWLGWQKAYLVFQFGLARYNALYGTFASVPVFFFWLFIGWTIILLGAEFAFAWQNQGTYHLERISSQASMSARLTLALAIMIEAAGQFLRGETVFNAEDYGHARRVPIRLVNDITHLLRRGGYLVELAERPGSFALNRTPDRIRAREIFDLIVNDGTAAAPLGLGKVHPAVRRAMNAWCGGTTAALGDKTLAEIAAEPEA